MRKRLAAAAGAVVLLLLCATVAWAHDIQGWARCMSPLPSGNYQAEVHYNAAGLGPTGQTIPKWTNTATEKNVVVPASAVVDEGTWPATFYDGTGGGQQFQLTLNQDAVLHIKHRDMAAPIEIHLSRGLPDCSSPQPTPTPSPGPTPGPSAPSVTIINNIYNNPVNTASPVNTATGGSVTATLMGQLPTATCNCGPKVKPPPACTPAKPGGKPHCPKLRRGQVRLTGCRTVGPAPSDECVYHVRGPGIERISVYLDGVFQLRDHHSPFAYKIRAGLMRDSHGRLLGRHVIRVKVWFKGCRKATTLWISYVVDNKDP
jgi:hypothetical protein